MLNSKILTAFFVMALQVPAFAMLPNPNSGFSVGTTAPMQPTSQSQGVSVSMAAFLVDSMGNLSPITQGNTVRAGDVVEYQVYYTNTTGEHIRSVQVDLDLAGLVFLGQASPMGGFASTDGVHFGRMPLRANIGGAIQEVPSAQYRNLRWVLEDIAIDGTAVVKFRAKPL